MTEFQAQWFATLGVGGIVAAFMFMFYRNDIKKYTDMWKEQAEQNREVVRQVLEVVKDNTSMLSRLVGTVESLHRRLDSSSSNNIPQRDPR
jgi:hypothetical protein